MHANNPLVDKEVLVLFLRKQRRLFSEAKRGSIHCKIGIWLKGRSLIVLKIQSSFPAETIAISRPEVASEWDHRSPN